VNNSELAWRLLSRRYGAELCYTPMLNSVVFLKHIKHRRIEFQTVPEDFPLIAQFCGDNRNALLEAASLVQKSVAAVDINLGCPQHIAKRGHYGSFLQDEWGLISDIITHLDRHLDVPVTAKIRVFPDVGRTVAYAQMIEEAGAAILTVHGRTREQKAQFAGSADWKQIRAVCDAVQIPVFANGNVRHDSDVDACLAATGASGVMVAEANLANPCMFHRIYKPIWMVADEYLEICENLEQRNLPVHVPAIRNHIFRMFEEAFNAHPDVRSKFSSTCHSLHSIQSLTSEFGALLQNIASSVQVSGQPYTSSSSGNDAARPSSSWFASSSCTQTSSSSQEVCRQDGDNTVLAALHRDGSRGVADIADDSLPAASEQQQQHGGAAGAGHHRDTRLTATDTTTVSATMPVRLECSNDVLKLPYWYCKTYKLPQASS
jgi:tRNA-dihydrouridine synthase 1